MLYLDGSYQHDMNSCLRLSGNKSFLEPLFLFYHEEADDGLIYHVNHAITIDRICSFWHQYTLFIIFLSGCTQSFGSCGWLKVAFSVANKMNMDSVDVLHAICKLTGCDTTSKVRTTKSSFQAGTPYGFEIKKSNVKTFDNLRSQMYYAKAF